MTETWEYGRLHIIRADCLLKDDDGEWIDDLDVVISQTQNGVNHVPGNGILDSVNSLGGEGWILQMPHLVDVDNNEVPHFLRDVLTSTYGTWGIIRKYGDSWMSRRIAWPDQRID